MGGGHDLWHRRASARPLRHECVWCECSHANIDTDGNNMHGNYRAAATAAYAAAVGSAGEAEAGADSAVVLVLNDTSRCRNVSAMYVL